MGSIELPGTVDLSHHLSLLSKSRHPSPLKDIIRFMGYDGMVSLAGGLPHPSLFPFQSAVINTYPASTVLNSLSPSPPAQLDELNLTKDARPDQLLSLTTALQYGSGSGDPALIKWAHEFTQTVFQPAYKDFEVLLNCGNTDAWRKVVSLLCEPGEVILCEEHTYPSAQALWIPMGCKAIPIKMDSDGIRPDDLANLMESWNETNPTIRRPHLLYIVPVGSNPTGLTMDGARRQAIYDICVKYDIIICEDDPYSFLQYGNYDTAATSQSTVSISPQEYVASLAPSFLKFDVQGRVIRLDTFSKTLAPGTRLGYFVANSLFTERLLRATEVETQAPSGWSQAIVMSLLAKWGISGYLEWLSNLRNQYRTRRNWMCNAITVNFDVKRASSTNLAGAQGVIAYVKGTTCPIFSFVPPTGGMFIWARFYFDRCPRFKTLQLDETCVDPEQKFADELWAELAKELVLLTPGSYYTPWEGEAKKTTKSRGADSGIGYFRLAFSMITKKEMDLGIVRMATILNKHWE